MLNAIIGNMTNRIIIRDWFHEKYDILPGKVMNVLVWLFSDVNGPQLVYMDEITQDIFLSYSTDKRKVNEKVWFQFLELKNKENDTTIKGD